ncbi:unnamed protein product [Mesocestoides corti]|uniref:RGS domain-containing protein n=1 Tax=Mesocestoides corti TaxID=53468 RepID=A0A0R3UG60_MESCO|nr:unnamed protein product [Mesocestoides corti]
MASGPLVFIHPVLEEGTPSTHTGTKEKSGGVLQRIGDEYFYWNAIGSTVSPTSTPPVVVSQLKQASAPFRPMGNNTVSSTGDLSADLLSVEWFASPRGHSDPNLQENCSSYSSAGLGAELSFNNCMYSSSVISSSAISPISCSSTPSSAIVVSNGTTTVAPTSNWVSPWQLHQQPSIGLNNKTAEEENFFTSRGFFSGLGSTATTIVNNRGGFFPTPPAPPPPPPPPPPGPNSNPFLFRENSKYSREVSGKSRGGAELPSSGTGLPGGNGSSSTGGGSATANSIQAAVFSKHTATPPLNRRSSIECLNKPVRPSSDTNVISLTDNPGAPMLKADSTLSLDTDSRARACCFCWCCCCSCSCIRVRAPIETGKRSTHSLDETRRTETQILEPRTTYEEVLSWSECFDNLMRCFTSTDGGVGQKAFREFLRSEYSEENILFWMACEDLKKETNHELVEEKARMIYEDYISILSPKEVSLDSKVRDLINSNMTQPTPHTFDEAQLQIYTLMQRDSYPRFLVSRIYKDLLAMKKRQSS